MTVFGRPVELQFAFDSAESLFEELSVEQSLVQPTTYREYSLRQLEGRYPLSEPVRSKMEECAAAVEAKLRPDDELWEWQAAEQSRLAGVSGLAILRGGEIIDSWVEWT